MDVAGSSNFFADELDEETAIQLRGDAIGDTVYSEVFVLRTLMKLPHFTWDTKFEDDLCFLWDMTEEAVVCKYLHEIGFYDIALKALTENESNNRFVEIIVGMFANVLCFSDCWTGLSKEDVQIVLAFLNSDDPLILVQVVRFLHGVLFIFDEPLFVEEILEKFDFILNSSTNEDLIVHTLKTLVVLVIDAKLDENLIKGDLIQGVITAYRSVSPDKQLITMKYYIQIIESFCTYINNLEVTRLVAEIEPYLDAFLTDVINLFNSFGAEETLDCVTDELIHLFVECFVHIFSTLNLRYVPEICDSLAKIVATWIESARSENDIEVFVQLFNYFVTVGSVEELAGNLRSLPSNGGETIVKYLEEKSDKFGLNASFLDKLQEVSVAIQN